MRPCRAVLGLLGGVLLLSGCGEPFADPNSAGKPCATISKASFDRAIEDGAVKGVAKYRSNGTVTETIGAGVMHCATSKMPNRICRRPKDLVIEYTLENSAKTYVKVRAEQQYRFRLGAKPTTCEIMGT